MTILLPDPLGDAAERGGAATAREIAQQPKVWRQLASSLDEGAAALQVFLRPLLARSDLRIVLTGAGTSSFAGEILAPVLTRRLRRRVDAVATTDLVSNPREHLAEDLPTLLVSFSRSGDSPESTGAVQLADRFLDDCRHLVVTCNPDGRLARDHRSGAAADRSHVLLMPEAADDAGFAMTSSFTSMTLAVLTALSSAGERVDTADVERLAVAAEHVLAHSAAVAATAGRAGRAVFLGSGPLKGLAKESALKVLELTAGRLTVTADSSLGFRHGPKAVLDDATVAIVYLSNDRYTRAYDLDILRELRAALPEGAVVAVSADGPGLDDVPDGPTWLLPGLGDVDDAHLALPAVLHAQLFALQASLGGGHAPDNPFPAGEVNRVVQGVTLHDPTG